MFRDLVILLPGITGSVLANPHGKEVWSPSAGAVWRAVVSRGGSIADLELPPGSDGGGIAATRLVPDVTIVPGLITIDGYSRIEQYLVAELGLTAGQNYFPFPYDWRLDNRVNARRLQAQALDWLHQWQAASGASDAKLVLIGHSMGGLVSRYFVECLGGWEQTRALVTIGTPHQGSLNAVDFLVHGMKRGVGPFGLDMTPLLRSFPSVYQLLPIYRCVDTGNGLAKVADAASGGQLPHVDAGRAADARAFHREIEDAQRQNAAGDAYRERGYRMVPLVGIEQPTAQSVRWTGQTIEILRSLDGRDDGGDGTVPRASATPIELERQDREIFAAERHGSLQNGDGPLANVKGVLTSSTDLSRYRAALPATLSLDLPDVVLPGEPLTVRGRAGDGQPRIDAHLVNAETGEHITDRLVRSTDDGWQIAEFDVQPGTWRVRIEAAGAGPVTDLVVVAAS